MLSIITGEYFYSTILLQANLPTNASLLILEQQKVRALMNTKQSKQTLLDQLYAPYTKCQSCPLGKLGRTHVVFGEGNPDTKLLFIGEGPGAQEDMQNRPFIGRSGQLLTKVLESAGVERKEVYITNIVKCRPPSNRAPFPVEISNCINLFLLNQIAIIKPRVICLLGATATRAILGEKLQISKIRGKSFKKGGIVFTATYHPAYILRNQRQLETFFNDLQQAIKLSEL